jgi:hypothetical protein
MVQRKIAYYKELLAAYPNPTKDAAEKAKSSLTPGLEDLQKVYRSLEPEARKLFVRQYIDDPERKNSAVYLDPNAFFIETPLTFATLFVEPNTFFISETIRAQSAFSGMMKGVTESVDIPELIEGAIIGARKLSEDTRRGFEEIANGVGGK